MSVIEQTGFFQDPPRLRDEWADDTALRRYIERVLPVEVRADVEPELAEMGLLSATTLADLAVQMNEAHNEPRLVSHDPWGNRIDRVETAEIWNRIGDVSKTHGVVATGYENKHAEHSRVHQFALAYLYAPSSALYSCPLAMTDGAAKTLTVHGDEGLKDLALPRLTSRDPANAWTSGQWMTERTGGSDVGLSQTVARQEGGTWRLYGTKWFTSAVTADMALTLARPEGNPDGGRGLAMFFVEVRDDRGRLNNIRVLRLKDKLGTRQMPTAELALDGTVAQLVGEPANGTRNITPMLTITRLWNSVTAASGVRRGLALARDYATRRNAFGRALIDQPLHQATLAEIRVQHESALQLSFRAVELLGREEAGVITPAEEALLRLLLPVTKLVTAKQAVGMASELLEAFGGAGYIEDTGLPVLLRDAQVLPIWEGTTNVLSLDTLRAIGSSDPLGPWTEEIQRNVTQATDADLAALGKQAVEGAEHARAWVGHALEAGLDDAQHGARRLAYTLGRSMQAALLIAQAQHDRSTHGDNRAAHVATRFVAEGLDVLEEPGAQRHGDAALAVDARLEE